MKTVILDMDDTIADCVAHWISILNDRYECNLEREDITDWKIANTPKMKEIGLSESQIFSPMNEVGFFRSLPLKKGAKEGVDILLQRYKVVIATSLPLFRPPGVQLRHAEDKVEWLEEHFPYFVETKNIIISKRKDLIKGDLLIDDAPQFIKMFQGNVLIMDAPWNRKLTNLPRAESWAQVPALCKTILQ
jgi:5'(3')-deoxyribonucleotidase